MFNMKQLSNPSKITCIEKQKFISKDFTSLLFGTENGQLIQIVVKHKEAILQSQKQVDNSPIISVINNQQKNKLQADHFFVLSQNALIFIDRLSLSTKNKYELKSQKLGSKEKFTNMIQTRLGDSGFN